MIPIFYLTLLTSAYGALSTPLSRDQKNFNPQIYQRLELRPPYYSNEYHLVNSSIRRDRHAGHLHPRMEPKTILQQPLNFTYNCTASEEKCAFIKERAEIVGTMIGEALKITVPIQVKFEILSISSLFNGRAAPIAISRVEQFYSARAHSESNWNLYPSALVKQLTDLPLDYGEFDITIAMDSDFDFWYGDTISGKMQSHDQDIDSILAHELTHGLGFGTGWINKDDSMPGIFPNVMVVDNIVKGWYPMTIYDEFIYYQQDMKLSDIGTLFFGSSIIDLSIYDQMDEFINLILTAYDIVTNENNLLSARFSEKNDDYLILYSPFAYSSASSLTHVDVIYENTPEFLMTPFKKNFKGVTFEQLIANRTNNHALPYYGAYGPKTLGLLAAMGWPTVLDNPIVQLEINPSPLLDH